MEADAVPAPDIHMRWGCTRPRGRRQRIGSHNPALSSHVHARPPALAAAPQTEGYLTSAVPSRLATPQGAEQATSFRPSAAASVPNGLTQPVEQQVQQRGKLSLWQFAAGNSVQSGASTAQKPSADRCTSYGMTGLKDQLIGSHPASVSMGVRTLVSPHQQLSHYKGSAAGYAALGGSQRQRWLGHEEQQPYDLQGCHKQATQQVCTMSRPLL